MGLIVLQKQCGVFWVSMSRVGIDMLIKDQY